jgi:hypothetical protein
LLEDLAWAELGIHPFPNDAGNENDDELKEENVHGLRIAYIATHIPCRF